MSEQTFGHIHSARRLSLRYDAPIKRASDIVVALVALILLAPVFALIAVGIKRDSPGPVIYRGARAGKGGKVFQILKFRTMYETPASYEGPKVTAHDDSRITPLGRWLRNTKLNELPQFWNVLRGDMSVVGPRPEDPAIAREWPQAVREKILSVRPGITSPASVLYHNEEALLCSGDVLGQYVREVGPDKVRLDELYVRYRSFYLDFDTLLWTALILLPAVRSQEPPESLLLVGPVTRFVRRYLSWFAIDALITIVAVGIAGGVWRIYGPLNVGWPKSIAAALAIALLFSITAAALGVNRINWSKARPDDVFDLFVAWLLAAMLAFGIDLLAHVLPLGIVVLASILALGGFVGFRYRTRLLTGLLSSIMRRRSKGCADRARVLIIGAGQDAEYAAWMLHRRQNAEKYELIGLVDDDLFSHGMRVYGADVLGSSRDLPALLVKHGINVVILADHSMAREQQSAISELCERTYTRFVFMPDTLDSLGDVSKAAAPAPRAAGEARATGEVAGLENVPARGAEVGASLRQHERAEVA